MINYNGKKVFRSICHMQTVEKIIAFFTVSLNTIQESWKLFYFRESSMEPFPCLPSKQYSRISIVRVLMAKVA